MPRYIDADALKSYLNEREYADMYYIEALFGIIDRQPTVSADEVREAVCGVGEWEIDEQEVGGINGEIQIFKIPFCSNCGTPSEWKTNYCPSCGARLRNGGTDDS